MKVGKKVLAMLLVLLLAFTCLIGCEKEDDDRKASGEERNDGNSKSSDIYGLLEEIAEINKGEYSLKITVDAEVEGESVDAEVELYGKVNGSDATLGLKVNGTIAGERISEDSGEFLVLAGDSLYINMSEGLEAFEEYLDGSVEDLGVTSLKWVEIPAPTNVVKVNAQKQKAVQDALMDLVKDILGKGELESKNNSYTVTFSEVSQVKAIMEVLADFIENDLEDVMKDSMEMVDSIDLDSYVKKLADFIESPLREVLADYEEYGITDDMVDELLDEMENANLNSQLENSAEAEMPTAEELKDAAEEIRDAAKELDDVDNDEIGDVSLVVTASKNSDTYTTGLALKAEGQTVEVIYSITEKDVTVKAPSDVTPTVDLVRLFVQAVVDQMGSTIGPVDPDPVDPDPTVVPDEEDNTIWVDTADGEWYYEVTYNSDYYEIDDSSVSEGFLDLYRKDQTVGIYMYFYAGTIEESEFMEWYQYLIDDGVENFTYERTTFDAYALSGDAYVMHEDANDYYFYNVELDHGYVLTIQVENYSNMSDIEVFNEAIESIW